MARTVAIIPAISRRVDIESVIKIGGIEAATSGVHVNITGWLKIGSGMRVAAHEANCKMIGNPVIKACNKSACGEIITLGLAIIVNIYPVAPAVRPDAPAVFRRGKRRYRLFGGY